MVIPVTVDEKEQLREALQRAQAETQQLSAALADSWEELTLLYELAESLRGVLDVDKAVRLTLEVATDIVQVEGGGLLFKPIDSDWSLRLALCPVGRDEWLQTDLGKEVAEETLRRKRGFILNDLWTHSKWCKPAKAFKVRNLIAVPINPTGQAQGALIVWNKIHNDFTSGELKFLSTIVAQTSGVLESAHLYQRLEETFRGAIFSLATVVDSKSRWTAGHSHRVTEYALWLSEHIKLSSDYLEKVSLSGLMHDIGKTGIPDAILEKPSSLTSEEFAIIQRHPKEGYRILSPIKQFHGDILDGILYHHERIDGKGYPMGLKGNEIPLVGRLIAIADGFDAMTSDRPYRPGMPKEEALNIIVENAEIQWDKELALPFVELMRDRPLSRAGTTGEGTS